MHALDADGRGLIPVDALSNFVKIAKVPNCPRLPQSHSLVWHIQACGPRKQRNFVCFVERPLLCQGCAIMWQCTSERERW